MNGLSAYDLPPSLPILFCVSFLLPLLLLANLARAGTSPLHRQTAFWGVLGTLLLYVGYVTAASLTGLFDEATFPPRVLLFSTLPYALVLFGVVYRTAWFRQVAANVPLPTLVRVHRFRVLGVFFLLLAYYGALPMPFALLAGLGDILTALTSPLVARALARQRTQAADRYARRLALVWNTVGLLDIVVTSVLANVLTKLALDTGTQGVEVLGTFPFCLIPAFAPPTIVLLHLLIYQRLKTTRNQVR